MTEQNKLAIVVRADLAGWQRLNVTAFLASGQAASSPELIGQAYEDASGNKYTPMFGLPVVVFAATAEQLTAAHQAAVQRGLTVGVYTQELFSTNNDEDNRAAVRAVEFEDLQLAGMSVHGPRNAVDKVCKRLKLHP